MKRVVLVLFILLLMLTGGGSKGAVIAEINLPVDIISKYAADEIVPAIEPIPKTIEIPAQEAPAPIAETQPARMTIIAAGDLMCLYAQLNAARKKGEYRFDYCFDEIRDKISGADLAICNLETLVAKGYIYTRPSPAVGSPKINAPESFLSAAVNCGFDVFINANNHILDRKVDGLNKTINALDKFGVLHTGAYKASETRKPLVADVKGIKVAILSYTSFINGHSKYERMADIYTKELVTADISAAKEAGADFIMVYMHWGNENTHKVTKAQRKTAAFVAEAGADIIIGSHPHCTQGTQLIETSHGPVPVFYSLGNLISSMLRTINRDSVLVNIVLEKDLTTGVTTLAGLTYTPTYCTTTGAGRFVILPADPDSIALSAKAKALKYSRARTIKVLAETAAKPE